MTNSLSVRRGTSCAVAATAHGTGLSSAWRAVSRFLALLVMSSCAAVQPASAPASGARPAEATQPREMRMWMTIGERRFAIALSDNEAARAFAAQLPLTLNMEDLNGNEKHAELPTALPARASRPGTIHSGDLMLYGTRTLVVFYLTFDSSYSYTRLGRIDQPAALAQTLGRRDVRVVFSKD
jgi:hypothetical protein